MEIGSAENLILTEAAGSAAGPEAGAATAPDHVTAGSRPRTRLAWPDWIRGAAIIAVVSVHLSGAAGFPDTPLLLWLNSFAMAVFFFVSGDLMIRRPSAEAVGTFAKRRAAAVLWPFFTFSVCAVLFDLAVLRLNGGQVSREMVTVWMRCIFTLVGKGTLWFLPVFYFGSVLAYAALKGRKPGETTAAGETGPSGEALKQGSTGAFIRSCKWEILLFLAGLGAMTFVDQIFAATVAAVTGGGDSAASDVFLVVIRSLAAAAIILEGAWTGPRIEKIVAGGSSGMEESSADERGAEESSAGKTRAAEWKGIFAAALCFAVSLVIPAVYRMDFRTVQFGRFPVLLFVSAAAAYGFLRRAAEDAERLTFMTYFGRYSLILMATHLEWYLVNLVWGGVAAVAGTAADFGPGFLARHLAALALILMIEYPLCGIIDRRFSFLLRLPKKR